MPATVRLADGTWLTAIRTGGRPSPAIEIFASTDDARTWQHRATAVAIRAAEGTRPLWYCCPTGGCAWFTATGMRPTESVRS